MRKLDATGSTLLYGSYFGSSGNDHAEDMTVDDAGYVYIAGNIQHGGVLPMINSYESRRSQGLDPNGVDIYLAKFDLGGNGVDDLVYSTYLGGSERQPDDVGGIAVNDLGHVYLTGHTRTTDFPTTEGAFRRVFCGGSDAFVTIIDTNTAGPDGLLYSTYFGGSSGEKAFDLALDASGKVYIVGEVGGGSIPMPTTIGAYDTTHDGGRNAFIAVFDPQGNGVNDLIYSTFYGSVSEIAWAVDVDAAGLIYFAGDGYNIPSINHIQNYNGGLDAFVGILNPLGGGASDLIFSTALGGSVTDRVNDLVYNSTNETLYLTGDTDSLNFTTTPGAYDRLFNGNSDAFMARIVVNQASPILPAPTIFPPTEVSPPSGPPQGPGGGPPPPPPEDGGPPPPPPGGGGPPPPPPPEGGGGPPPPPPPPPPAGPPPPECFESTHGGESNPPPPEGGSPPPPDGGGNGDIITRPDAPLNQSTGRLQNAPDHTPSTSPPAVDGSLASRSDARDARDARTLRLSSVSVSAEKVAPEKVTPTALKFAEDYRFQTLQADAPQGDAVIKASDNVALESNDEVIDEIGPQYAQAAVRTSFNIDGQEALTAYDVSTDRASPVWKDLDGKGMNLQHDFLPDRFNLAYSIPYLAVGAMTEGYFPVFIHEDARVQASDKDARVLRTATKIEEATGKSSSRDPHAGRAYRGGDLNVPKGQTSGRESKEDKNKEQ